MYKAKTFEEFEKSYFDARGYPENEILSTQEDFEMNYMWWLGQFADRLKERHGLDMGDLFVLINGVEPEAESERVQRGEPESNVTLQDFLFGCFKGGDEAADSADRALQLQKKGEVDGQVREKGIGNA